jgi:NAD(P)-dependent dehydrogenase (short-subunit alcohol dehydrogenase family)
LESFQGRAAVITGAASGIGLAMARKFAGSGMHLVIADIDEAALRAVARELAATGVQVTPVVTDVSSSEDVEALADTAFATYGEVAVLCNNAGVTKRARSWDLTLQDWTWVLGVDLWGVIHGVRSFVPRLIAQRTPAHIVNTSSMTGLLPLMDVAAYAVAKTGVVALSECLQIELADEGADIGVSVLNPGFIATNIAASGRNRPAALAATATANRPRSTQGLTPQITAEDVADQVLDAIRSNRFWILTHPAYGPVIVERATKIGSDAHPQNMPVW